MSEPRTIERTEWAVRRIEDGELTTTTQVGLYAPGVPMSEEDAHRWIKFIPGYEVVRRNITKTITAWEAPIVPPPVAHGAGAGEGAA